mgnify:FL=1
MCYDAVVNIRKALADITSTDDLLERALKLAGLVSTLFADVGFKLVVVGKSAVEFCCKAFGGKRAPDLSDSRNVDWTAKRKEERNDQSGDAS